MSFLENTTSPRQTSSRYSFVTRGWLGQADKPVIALHTVNLSATGAQVRHEAPPPPVNARPCLRLSLIVGDKVQLLDINVKVRESVISKGFYLTQLDFDSLPISARTVIDQVLRGRPASSSH